MSNTFIGFKQADGSFYPVLKDGIAESKQLDVTTVRDDQTAVKINLYKKNTDSLDEPEYVDTLLIENLIPHPKQEPTIHLKINLDEDNVLAAEISDPETGNKSDIRVSMVTLPADQLDAEPDFEVSSFPQNDFSIDENTAKDTPADLSFDMPDNIGFDMPEDLNFDMEAPEEEKGDDSFADNAGEADDSSEMSFDMPEFEEEDAFASSDSEELSLNDDAPIVDDDFPTPHSEESGDFSFGDTSKASSMSFDMDEPDDFSPAAGGSDDSTMEEMSFDMPDDMSFDMPDNTSFETSDNTSDDSSFDMHDDKPFDTPPVEPDFEEVQNESSKKKFGFGRKKQASFVRETPPLYDQNLPDDIDDSCSKKKCRIAVIICIICAILCILAVIGIFLLFPWKKSSPPQTGNIVTVEPPSHMQMQTPPEEPAKPEENTIVVVEKETVENREVVPEKFESAAETKPSAVRYLIKWGDTLWDLSDTYYRNPWLYPIIARENKIKNPDLIIAGTYIVIPPR